MEAWWWLEREGLIVQEPEKDPGNYFISRRGQSLARREDVSAYRKAGLLPQQRLHPVLAQKAWGAFVRGDYDVAVFQAFKEVEVAVRTAAGLSAGDIGIDLMRKAFKPGQGPLTDLNALNAEQQSTADLFAGAIVGIRTLPVIELSS